MSGVLGLQLRQGAPLADTPESSDQLGAALAAGDFNADRRAELVLGAPGENGGRGIVHVLQGARGGVTASGQRVFSQDTAGMSGTAEFADDFGRALATGDFNDDDRADLAIGVPGDEANGAVNVLYGEDANGLGTTHQELLTENTIDAGSDLDANDRFGATVASGDFNADNKEDLAVGLPRQAVVVGQTALFGAGEIDVTDGSNPLFAFGGLNEHRAQALTENAPGIAGVAEAGDHLGSALADLPQ